MPFPTFIFLNHKITNNTNVTKFIRREGGVDLTHKKLSCNMEKASVSASGKKKRASITVEAVFCIPLFFYAAVCLIWMLEIRAVQSAVKCGLQEAGKKAAAELFEIPIIVPAELEADIINAIGKERLARSMISGGGSGIECKGSYVNPMSGIMELRVQYKVRLPFPIFAIPLISCQESMRIKAWTGYEKQGFSGGNDRTVVYVTETGVVYHKDYHCTYLEPSLRIVSGESLEALRNAGGGKYHACERCMGGAQSVGSVYITTYGERYHSTLSCSGLKRKIYAVPITEIKGKGACSKCGR